MATPNLHFDDPEIQAVWDQIFADSDSEYEFEGFTAEEIDFGDIPNDDTEWEIENSGVEVADDTRLGCMMPRDRFELILKFLHFNDNAAYVARGEAGYDPLFKIRPLYDTITCRLSEVYTCEQCISLDEGMVPWRGNIHFRQYIPSKPDRFGLKSYMVSESSSGYTSVFDIYTGKNYTPNPDTIESENEGHTFNVVMGLMRKASLLNKGYKLYTDNYYTSHTLIDHLKAEDTMLVGTARMNRKEMPAALKLPLRQGEVIYRQRNGVLAMKWKDKRDVTMLSS
uniref:PiggyBac transposable element-derived protein 4-like n=1 Tax=Saccoglossus kowalevskii TaxID=10224 RepID=A0ABM0MTM6_SACKO